MHEYDVRVTRDGRWWKVPEIDQITRARRISEIEESAQPHRHHYRHTTRRRARTKWRPSRD
jgi:hypothetical protein